MKQKILVLIILSAAFLVAQDAHASHSAEICTGYLTDQTWTLAGSPYIINNSCVQGGASLGAGVTLTIEPGVVVKLKSGASISGGLSSKIIANGTASQPIIFTSAKEDMAGHDEAGDPASGDWSKIFLGDSRHSFTYTEIRYGTNCLALNYAVPTISNNIIRNCGYGIDVQYATSTPLVLQNNTIRNNTWGLRFLASAGASFSNNNIYSNSEWGVENQTWQVENVVVANDNWWGNVNGPCMPADYPVCVGKGDKVSIGVTVSSFLTAEVGSSPASSSWTPPFTGGGGGGTNSPASVAPRILRFEASSANFREGEGGVELSWETRNAEFVSLVPSPDEGRVPGGREGSGEKSNLSLSGSLIVQPEKTTKYKLVALGPGGEVSAELVIEVIPRDPVVIVPGILGTFGGRLDPILHTYDGLWEGLKSVGYTEGKTLFAFPYNWRNDNRETAKLLGQKIDSILQVCACQKVDVVAHSMGGLVARYYIANINDVTIDQLIFLGTPHLGAPKAYLAWEAGEMGPRPEEKLAALIFELEAISKKYKDIVKYIQEQVISVQQLLPIYRYLTDYNTGEFYDYEKCREGLFSCNNFLEELSLISISNSIRVYNLVNDQLPTPRAYIVIKEDSKRNIVPGKWKSGKPFNYPKADGILFGSGDITVPSNSARASNGVMLDVSTSHSELPFSSQSEIAKILINKEIVKFGRTPVLKKIFFIGIKSPADIIVTDPNGNSFGLGYGGNEDVFYDEELEFITIPDPAEGQYSVSVIGNGEGVFELETSLIGDDLEETKSFSGVIAPGEEFKFSVNTTAESLGDLQVLQTPPPPLPPAPVEGEIEVDNSSQPSLTLREGVPPLKVRGGEEELSLSPPATSTPVIPASEPESSLTLDRDRGPDSDFRQNDAEGAVKGITTENKKQPLILYIISGLAILIAGYLSFKQLKKQKI